MNRSGFTKTGVYTDDLFIVRMDNRRLFDATPLIACMDTGVGDGIGR
jgi:hypothetical protein